MRRFTQLTTLALAATFLAGCGSHRYAQQDKAAAAHVSLARDAGGPGPSVEVAEDCLDRAREATVAAETDLADAAEDADDAKEAASDAKDRLARARDGVTDMDGALAAATKELERLRTALRLAAPQAQPPVAGDLAAAQQRMETLRAARAALQKSADLADAERRAAELAAGGAAARSSAAEQRLALAQELFTLAETLGRLAEVEGLSAQRAAIDARLDGTGAKGQ